MTSLLIVAAVLGWNMEFADGSSARVNYDNAAVAPYTLEFVAQTADGKSQTKLVVPEGFNHSLKHEKAKLRQVCYFSKDELGEGAVRFSVTPINCFGARGRTIEASYGRA